MKKPVTTVGSVIVVSMLLVFVGRASAESTAQKISDQLTSHDAPTMPPLLASQVKPHPRPLITGHGLPPEFHLSGKSPQNSGVVYPIQRVNRETIQRPLDGSGATAVYSNAEKKDEGSITPNIPDPDIILQGGDTFAGANVITSLPYYDTGTTVGYTNDYEGTCGGTGAPDVVYRFSPSVNTGIDISLCDATNYDSKVYVCNGDPSTVIACNDDACGLQSALYGVNLFAGNIYYIVVDGFSSHSGNYSLSISEVPFVPNPCQYGGDAVYSNGASDLADGGSDFRSLNGTYDRWVVDDAVIGNAVFVNSINWLCLSSVGFDWNSTADVMILTDNSGAPGVVYYTFTDLPCTRTLTGRAPFGIDEYVYSVSGFSAALAPGTYWIGVRPVSATTSNNFWETAPVTGNPVYVSMPDLGFPMWSTSVDLFGVNRDVCFCLMGNYGTDPCEEVTSLWQNGMPDYINGWYDFRTTDGANDFFIVDNVSMINPVVIHSLDWVTVDGSFSWNGTADYIILADNSGIPGAVIYEVHDLPCTRTGSGNVFYGLDEYRYTITGLNINLPSGQYWVGMRAVGSSGAASFWLTTGGDGIESYVDYSYFGYPRWTPSSTAMGASTEFSFCIGGEFAPPPDPCTDGAVLFSNALPDGVNGLYDCRTTDGTYDFTVVADFSLAGSAVIENAHWLMLEDTFDWNGTADIVVLDDNSGSPGSLVFSQSNIPTTKVPTGRTLFGLPEFTYTVSGLSISLAAGNYWIGMRPVAGSSPLIYWETAPMVDNPVFLDYPYFGYPAWTPCAVAYGVDFDVAFCLTGESAGGCSYVPGDVNNNTAFNGIDVSYSVGYFKGGPLPPYSCDCNGSTWFVAGDVNGNCAFNGIDVSYMVTYFKGGPAPVPCSACPPVTLSRNQNTRPDAIQHSEK